MRTHGIAGRVCLGALAAAVLLGHAPVPVAEAATPTAVRLLRKVEIRTRVHCAPAGDRGVFGCHALREPAGTTVVFPGGPPVTAAAW
ncbi:hypothetical protein [Amycolatopsis sp. NPDC049159]|uniref:hypothetical protein n=1 Tax=unclassified Amycolatopsis TaxID=2618356 RepID=UPI0034095CF7